MSCPTDNRQTQALDARGEVSLRVLNGPESGRRLSTATLPCTVGRGGSSRIRLLDPDDPPGISREHAVISRRDGNLVLTDSSTNGTRVVSRWLNRGETESLRPGDELQLGPSLRLRVEGTPARGVARDEIHPPSVSPNSPVGHPEPTDFRLRISSRENLAAAWRRVWLNRGCAGPDGVTVSDFAINAARRLGALRDELLHARYRPLPARIFAAPKRRGGVRRIAILTVRDRVVQQAIHLVLQPVAEPHLPDCSYAYRPGRSAHDALRAIDGWLNEGRSWAAETDIAGFFDHVDHALLLDQLATIAAHQATIGTPWLLSLINVCLSASGEAKGIPQGGPLSPLLSNIYLAGFDRHLLRQQHALARYGDDLVVMCRTRGDAQAALAEMEAYLRRGLGLSLNPEKTRVTPLERGFTFLGYHFDARGRRASPVAIADLRERLDAATPAQVPAILRGWRQYFRAGDPSQPPAEPAMGEATRPQPLAVAGPCRPRPEVSQRLLQLFAGRDDMHARETFHTSAGRGRRLFTPCSGSITSDLAEAHLAGTACIAHYLVLAEGFVRTLVLDVDAEGDTTNPAVGELSHDLWRELRRVGVPAFREDSGRRGEHVWVCFSEPVPVEDARRLARLTAARVGVPRPGVRLEIFPRRNEWTGPELGDAVKMPLGLHPATGRRCSILDERGDPIRDPGEALESIRTITAVGLQSAIGALRGPLPDPAAGLTTGRVAEAERAGLGSDPIAALLGGCTVISGLANLAERAGHLRHVHLLTLLYTAGHLGKPGRDFIHRTTALCRNYDPHVCQRFIDALEPREKPISCRRIREWLEETGEQALCTCPGERRSPLDLVSIEKATRSRIAGTATPEIPMDERDLWCAVEQDLFAPQPPVETAETAEADEVAEASHGTPPTQEEPSP